MVNSVDTTLTSDEEEDPEHDGCGGQTNHKEDTDHGAGVPEESVRL
jgi:hypothetical protein